MHKIVMGIDIGMVNYGICVIMYYHGTKWKILYMNNENTGIKRKTERVPSIGKKVKILLNKVCIGRDWLDNLTDVVIESQPGKRLIMERILMSTVNYFQYLFPRIKIKLMRSTNKFGICKNMLIEKKLAGKFDGRSNYYNRKKMSVDLGFLCLSDKRNELYDPNASSWLMGNDKKDDLCDALLLILHYVGYKYS